MDLLRVFNGDYHTKEALLEFFIGYFEEEIIKRAKAKEPVESLAEALNELPKAFDKLKQIYEPPTPIKETTSQNR